MQVIFKKLADEYSLKIEEYLRIVVRDKPKYLPYFIWKWLIKKIIFIEIFK